MSPSLSLPSAPSVVVPGEGNPTRRAGVWSFIKTNLLSPIGKAAEFVVDLVQKELEERRRYIQVMGEIDWPPTKLLDFDTQRVVLQVLGNRQALDAKADIEAALLKHFDPAKLQKILDDWILHFPPVRQREAILKQVLKAHSEQYYWLTIPTIHAQIDGLLGEAFGLKHGGGTVSWKRLGKLLRAAKWRGGAHGVALNFLNHRVLVDFTRGQPLESDHSRHAISHGVDIQYGTPENSLKAILLLDYVIWAVSNIRFVEAGVYHLPNCARITQPLEQLPILRHPWDAFQNRQIGSVTACETCEAGYFRPNNKAEMNYLAAKVVPAVAKENKPSVPPPPKS